MKHLIYILSMITAQALAPSSECTKLIKKYETLSLTPYRCPGGKLTIGYGHVMEKPMARISEAQANKLLHQDIITRSVDIRRLITVPLTQPKLDALVSLVFNIGTNAFAESTLLKHINARADENIIQSLWLQWHHIKTADSQGLLRRRQEEIALYRRPTQCP